jgi:hypothetical protein
MEPHVRPRHKLKDNIKILLNKLPVNVLGTLPCKPSNFRRRVRKLINKAK